MAEPFQQDLTCSVCQDFFTEPVLLACGHCFCRDCIAGRWDSREAVAKCPDCRAPCFDRKYTPVRLLGNLAQKARRMQQEEAEQKKEERRGGKGAQELRCEAHGDSLGLFCITDEAPVCYRCVSSPAHAGHCFSSLQDGAEKQKEKLAQRLESLKLQIKDLEGCECSQKGHMTSLRDSAILLCANIEAEFSELQQFLNLRKDVMLAQLKKEEQDAQKDMETCFCKIRERLHFARNLRRKGKALMGRKNSASLLLAIQSFLHGMTAGKSDNKDLAVLCKDLCRGNYKGPTQHLACGALHSAFRLKLEPVELDTNTAHPIFIISQNGTYVMTEWKLQKCCDNPKKFQNYHMILGRSGFCSGKHYWEIETKDMAVWTIGVAANSIERKVRVPYQDIEDKIQSVHLPISSADATMQRFGVYLDYEEGQVSFYDAKNYSLIHTCKAQFKEEVYPFFWNSSMDSGRNASLKICHK